MLKNEKNNKNKNMEYKTSPDGKDNPKYVDLLDEDRAISGQKFVCLSFISPEKEIKQRETYLFEQYVKEWDMKKSLEKYSQFLSFIAFKHKLDYTIIDTDFTEFCKEEKDNLFLTNVADDYKTFLDKNEDKLMETYNEHVSFQTSVRGIKVRGSYPTQAEAELRCKMLREMDPSHDVYVGPIGSWMPFHPEAYKTGRVEYMEEELNQLMHEKGKNEEAANFEFEKRVKESKVKAMEENKRRSLESNNPLTQMLNEDGELVSVANSSTIEKSLGNDNVAVADIRKELFEGDNIITGNNKNSDHGYNNLTAVKKLRKKNSAKTNLGSINEANEDDANEDEKKDNITVTEQNETEYDDNMVSEHTVECADGVCTLPAFKKCKTTGEKNEIVCECMVGKNKATANDIEEV